MKVTLGHGKLTVVCNIIKEMANRIAATIQDILVMFVRLGMTQGMLWSSAEECCHYGLWVKSTSAYIVPVVEGAAGIVCERGHRGKD